ncbi:TadE/TadG family type IV pilus assembly protein [Hyalangium rubrum]|uniref:TadE family protein n=1 Tax=Hyalangium rubrum TaxID=3103134 RepID=A0ABU5GZQ8_9BACT|nr:TadE family protein [Hyalangium sp. s54d21]MDY7226184.1 TadE family protein [Hyalangium sp. s54d21]
MISRTNGHQRGESGQAAVEAALTLPLTVFLILGTLQLFLMLQGRIMAEYAAFEAVRAGSRHHGDCKRMMHATLAGLLPSVVPYLGNGTRGGTAAEKLALAWRQRIGDTEKPEPRYKPGVDGQHDGPIFWLAREQPLAESVPGPEDERFDAPGREEGGIRLEVRLIYWFPLKVPFADWVMSRMFLAHYGLRDYTAANPLMLAQKHAGWTAGRAVPGLDRKIRDEFVSRFDSRQYVFPIQATYGMRMMTPAQAQHFQQQNCGDMPQRL